jgi:hypothetical protein
VRRHAAAAEDRSDEGEPDAAVAVGERVDALELGVGDRCLGDRLDVVSVREGDEVLEQAGDRLRRVRTRLELGRC